VWNLGKHYKWINVIAMVWVVICVVIFCLPTGPAAVPWDSGFNWDDFNYAPLVTIALALGSGSLGGRCQEYVQGPGEDGRRSRRRHADGSGAHANELSRETIRRLRLRRQRLPCHRHHFSDWRSGEGSGDFVD